MAKKRLQVWLSQEALRELERRAGASDKRQAYLESWLTGADVSRGSRKPVSTIEDIPRGVTFSDARGSDEILAEAQRKLEARRLDGLLRDAEHKQESHAPDDEVLRDEIVSGLSAEAKQARAEKKAARTIRKAELAESVKGVLPVRSFDNPADVAPILNEEVATYCPKHRPKWCEPDCKHRVPIE